MAKRAGREQASRVGMAGYGCLTALMLAGLGGGTALMLLGIAAFQRAREADVTSSTDATLLLSSLEGAVILCGASALAFLVGITATVVVVKELADDAGRTTRGPV